MLEVFRSSAPYLLTIVVLKVMVEFGYLSKAMKPAASELIGKIGIIKLELQFADLKLVVIGFVIVLSLQSVIYYIARLMSQDSIKQMTLVLAFGSFSLGAVIYPIVQLNFETRVFEQIVLFDSIGLFFVYMTATQLFAAMKSGKGHSLSQGARFVITSPIFIAVVAGLILNLLGFVPEALIATADYGAKSFGFLAAFVVAMNLSLPKLSTLRTVTFLFSARMLFVVIVATALVQLVNLPKNTQIAVMMSTFAPVSVMGLVFAEQYGFDEKYYAQVLAITTLLSLIIAPFATGIIKLLI